MTLKRRKHKRPPAPPVRGPGTVVRALDSEDQSGTYARPDSGDDSGESDEGVFAQGPFPSKSDRPKRRKEAPR